MNAILNSLKNAARAAVERLKALWARLRTKTTEAAHKVALKAKNIWRDHQELILWTLAWIAFGTLAALGLAGVYYTSPAARLWLEETALAVGKLVAAPFSWLKKRNVVQHPAPAQSENVAFTAQQPASRPTPSTPPQPATTSTPSRVTYKIPIPADQVKPKLQATGGATA